MLSCRITKTGLTEGIVRYSRGKRTILNESSDEEDHEEIFDAQALLHAARAPPEGQARAVISKREASHDYD
jgi:hypothetical protein